MYEFQCTSLLIKGMGYPPAIFGQYYRTSSKNVSKFFIESSRIKKNLKDIFNL